MGRTERRVMRINDQIGALRAERELVSEELMFHRHINDDAQRDAAVSDHPMDRADARETAADVARFERSLSEIDERIEKLVYKRERLLDRMS